MWEKWGGGKKKVKQPKLWQGRAPLCWRQRRGQAPCPAELSGRDEGFCVYQGVDDFLQTGIILQIEDQQRNRTRKSKNIIWGKSFICCDLGLNPPINVVGFVAVVVIKKGGEPNSGDFNDLLSRIVWDLRRKRTYTTAEKNPDPDTGLGLKLSNAKEIEIQVPIMKWKQTWNALSSY